MEKEERTEKHWRGAMIFGVVCVIVFLIWELGVTVPLFYLGGFRESEVKKIHLMLEYSGEDRTKAYRGFYSVDDLPGHSPSAIITLYDSVDDSDGRNIYIYYDLVLSDAGNYYGLRMESAHRRLADLCETYGQGEERDE